MENTPTGCADDLPSILGIFPNDPKSRSVNNSLQQLNFNPNSIKNCVTSQSSAQTGAHPNKRVVALCVPLEFMLCLRSSFELAFCKVQLPVC